MAGFNPDVPDRDHRARWEDSQQLVFPIGNTTMTRIATSADLGRLVRERRKAHGLTQDDLALVAGTGRRFVVDLEAGKGTARLELVLRVLDALGLDLELTPRG
jgi:y4mF family transcriptional regulator